MASLLGHLSISYQLLFLTNSLDHPITSLQTRLHVAVGAKKGISGRTTHDLRQTRSLRRNRSVKRTGSQMKTLVFISRLEETNVTTSTLDSRVDLDLASSEDKVTGDPNGFNRESALHDADESASQLVVDQIELEKEIAIDSRTGPPPPEVQAKMEKPMDLESRGAAELEHPYSHLTVAPRWREIQGENNWADLLDPMDPVLRGEVIRYGEFAQATYDAFDYNTHSPYCGSCKYNKKRLLQMVGLENRGYEVTDYLYATAGDGHPVANFFKKIDLDVTDDIDSEEIWDKESNWMGYVAVATDPKEIFRLGRRDIVIVWRGTVTKLEWLENLRDYLRPTGFDPRNCAKGRLDLKVEAGFLQLYKAKNETSKFSKKSAREQVIEAVKRLVHQYRYEELSITITGHSLGSALAKLCAYDIAESSLNVRLKPHDVGTIPVPEWEDPKGLAPHLQNLADKKIEKMLGPIPITVFSFGGPRVGNDAYRDRMEELGVKVLRVVNKNDKVPNVPGVMLNEKMQWLEDKVKPFWRFLDNLPWTYSHVGVALELDNLVSPFLRRTKDPLNAHNLEAYLHLVDGWHGTEKEFKPVIARDIALVNKACNFIRPKHYIPPSWFQEENKGLMRTKEGKWIPRTRHPEDRPDYGLENKTTSST